MERPPVQIGVSPSAARPRLEMMVTGYWCLTSLNIAEMISDRDDAGNLSFYTLAEMGGTDRRRRLT